MFFLDPIRNFYGRFERPISSLSLVGGFVFDALTLHRVDTLWENLWVLGHLLIVGIFITLIHLQENERGAEKNPQKAHFWYVNILQFFFGGILSTYLVFYFRSADIFVTWPFIVLLALAFIANESLKRHYIRLSFQISLFFLSIYSFAIFIVPVILHRIGAWVFLLSGFLSLLFITVFLLILFYFINLKSRNITFRRGFEADEPRTSGFFKLQKIRTEEKFMFRDLLFLILGISILINFLYFTNLIPPIPLSLKDAGVYHSIQKNSEGNYDVTFEDYGWRGYFNLYQNFNQVSGEPIYAFSAIFSPKNLNLTIVHEWQYYDEIQKKWVTGSTINLPVVGGRDGGFRTYSMRYNLAEGKWRVNVKTKQGQTIGVLRFNIIQTDTEPALTEGVK
ncbi:MAG: DUF2914 domain-containing protein [Candidatus Pacebacteria bacterium]|nr:DUF2914 domain-containing protein [Candidatus Paceibacterota bacterium]